MEQKWGAVCVERRKHGSGRGLRKPALVIMQGGAFLLYFVGNGMMIHCGNPISYASIETDYWRAHYYCMGRIR